MPFSTLFLSFLIKNFATQQSQTAWKIRDVKLPGVLHLEGQIQSLIKSSAKELGGFASAFLTAHHSIIQSDLAAPAQETSSRRSVLVHWEIAGIMVTHPTAHSTHHQGRDSILQVTVDPQIQLHCSNRGVGGFLIFLWHFPAQGWGGPSPQAVCTTEQAATRRAHGFLGTLRSTEVGSAAGKHRTGHGVQPQYRRGNKGKAPQETRGIRKGLSSHGSHKNAILVWQAVH